MKLAIGYSTKNQFELTEQTWPRLLDSLPFDSDKHKTGLFWCDASSKEDPLGYFEEYKEVLLHENAETVYGGADAAIAWKLSNMLASPEHYTHIMLIENDVLLSEDWFEPTIALFKTGESTGLSVGAVSPRSYADRVLIQRDGWAAVHNIGAGAIIFTREAAEIVLRTFRTNWWSDNRRLFAQLSGIDLATYAAFRGNEQWTTTDWAWEAQLARHGLASLALTPARCRMVGQTPSLQEQGLELTTEAEVDLRLTDESFGRYCANLACLRFKRASIDYPGMIHREGAGMLFFPHQLGALNAEWSGSTILKWSQGFGPFIYRAGKGGASLSVRVSGISQFLCTGGDAGARVTITDTRSGFNFAPDLPAQMDGPASISVPGGPLPRLITLDMAEGAVFYGLQTTDPQMIDTSWKFDWAQLPPAVTNGHRGDEV